MTSEIVARAVQLILAPVVMISSAAVILNGLLTHYGEINGRIRDMDRERFDLVHQSTRADADERLLTERLAQIDHQIPDLLERHRIIHDAMLSVYYAIVVLVTSMFVVAAAALTDQAWLATLVIVLLLAGTAVLLYGMLLTTTAIRRSRRSIVYEAQGALRIARTPTDSTRNPAP